MGKRDRERAKAGLVHRDGQIVRIRIKPTPEQQNAVDRYIRDFMFFKFPQKRR